MRRRRWLRALLAMAAAAVVGFGACRLLWPERFAVNAPVTHLLFGRGIAPAEDTVLARLRTPDGFAVTRFADALPNVRFLRVTAAGDLLASQPREGRVVLLERDADGDGRADGVRVLLEGLNRPHGLDLHEGWLYVAETDAVGRVRFDATTRSVSGGFERVVSGLPSGGNHWTRTLRFGPDGGMYVSIGSSCNVCIEEDARRAAIVRYRPDGSGGQVFARGLRNAVGFDWRPVTGALYATDNGRDLLGDDFPPCELNRVVEGGFYGWPFANGDRVPDPDLGAGHEAEIAASIPPVHGFRAHNAPLGIAFVGGEALPPAYRGAALVALHGSWNRTRKDGYKVVSLHFAESGSVVERDFLWGFLRGEDVIGRPVDVAQGPDGAVYVSDDYAGSVFRIGYGEEAQRVAAAARGAARGAGGGGVADPSGEARGAVLWERNRCATCHDPNAGIPGMVTRDLTGLARRLSEEQIVRYLAAPTPPMPLFALSEAERRDLARYLRAVYR